MEAVSETASITRRSAHVLNANNSRICSGFIALS
jgi:hypothetical protein